jgi:hypothetical protein
MMSASSNIVDLVTDGTAVIWADSGDQAIYQVSSVGAGKFSLAGTTGVLNVGLDNSSGTVFWSQSDGNFGMAHRGMNSSGQSNVFNAGTTNPFAFNVDSATQVDILTNGFLQTWISGTGNLADTTLPCTNCGKTLTHSWFLGDVTNGQVLHGGGTSTTGMPDYVAIPNQPGVNYLAEDSSYVYWATSNPAIHRAAFNNQTVVLSVLANPGGTVGALATDGKYVYYQAGSGIFYVPVAGASSGTLLTSLNGIYLRYAGPNMGPGALFFAVGKTIYKIATP